MMNNQKEQKPRKKGSGKILYVIGAVLLVLAIAVTGVASFFSGVLDVYVGTGKPIVSTKVGAENWDTKYYACDYPSAEATDVAAKDTTKTIAGEGITLLKNSNDTLPLKTSVTGGKDLSVSLFGRRSVDTVWGGTGSGAGDAGQCTPIADALTAAGYKVNDTLTALYRDNLSKVTIGANTMDKLQNMTYYIGEFPMSYYTDSVTSTYASYGDAAIVVFGRQGGEGMDFSTNLKESISSGETAMDGSVAECANYEDGQHQLELSFEEKALLAHVEENFETVIVVINSANVMELGALEDDENVDAVVWLAYPGSRGTVALAEILNGTICPSGHTVDTWPRDLTADPTFPNTKISAYSNVDEKNALEKSYMAEYEEGIYVGYRYYETAAAEGFIDYDSAVVYPFGYGLSYTTFSQEITGVTEENGTINVNVKVTNTGSVYAGKDVVQIYVHAPYDGTVEKAEVVLVGYEKSPLLNAGESAEVTVSFTAESMASYDYKNEGCYVLSAGDYELTARKNAHEVYGDSCSYTYTVAETVVYGETNPRQTEVEAQKGEAVNLSAEAKEQLTVNAAVNRFPWLNEHFEAGKAVNMSRRDFAGTFPTAPTAEDLKASDETIARLGAYKPDYYDAADEMPATGKTNNIAAVALRGLTYDDPKWESLLDQMTLKEMNLLIVAGNQGSVAAKSISLPTSKSTDGPAGLKQYGGLGLGASGNFNCCGTLVAATWNVELAEAYGLAVGNEAQNASVDGWYAPGTDLHRTAFGGRNFEYYSEDPLVSGKTCAGTIQGCSKKGVVCYFKHFVLNDIETHREDNAPCIWANEQALRELYLKAFEIAVKEPRCELKYLNENGEVQYKTIRSSMGVMSSFNRIGDVWTGGCKELITGVLRGEWGFMGCVVTDYNDEPQMHVEQGIVAGNDLMLANESTIQSKITDNTNPSTAKAMRAACKNIIYTLVNSGAVNGLSDSTTITYATSPWKIAMYAFDGVMILGAAACIALGVIKGKKAKKAEEAA